MGRLDRYIERRDFGRTPEPRGGAPSTLALRYGIQLHDATRRHFDLRLEWDGVLLSWAVTRGPSLRPDEKRLAVRTEDHPLDYLGFEGVIPEASYGAGTVMLWDIGHWQPLDPVRKGLAKGHLHFRLHGRRLTGDWNLVRMGGAEKRENWLLIKAEDEAAGRRDPVARYRHSVATNRTLRDIAGGEAPRTEERAGKRAGFRKPQLASLDDRLAEGAGWWHELKFDGYRSLVALGKAGPRLFTRSGQDWSDRFESLLPGFAPLACRSALIDGEVVAGAGLAGFSNLQKAIKAGGPFTYYAFDLLERDGEDLAGRPLSARRKALEALFREAPPLGPVQLSPLITGDARESFERICAAGGEGLIAKRIDAPYRGERSADWRKVKCRRRDEFVVLGWQASDKPGRPFASLALGAHRGGDLVYVGRVGTGFDEDQMADLAARMDRRSRRDAPAEVTGPEARGVHWITPDLVAEVDYAEMTAQGRLRHAVFRGLRADKPGGEVMLEGDRMAQRLDLAGIAISHPDRVIFPDAGVTKGDIARYYAAMAERMLAACANRPLSLLRLPEGLEGERFFQKHAGKGFPEALHTVEIEESGGGKAPYIYVADAAGLVAAAQMGTIELHIWGARRDRLDRPERMVFDLDPDESLPWAEVASAAADLRDRLADLGLPSWAMVTGGKGVHVVVPLRRVAGWETVKLYARIFATSLAESEPNRFVAEMAKAKRNGRIFIDWLRNERGATAIAPFSLRARQGAPAAVPVTWDELGQLRSARAFPLAAALERGWDAVSLPEPVSLGARLVDRLEAAAGQRRKPQG